MVSDLLQSNNVKEVIFIDTGIDDWQSLTDGAPQGVDIVALDPSRNGLAQMAEWAEGKSGYDAMHVLSHGSQGQVQLGTASLNNDTLPDYAEALAQIGQSLTKDGDILLYGCDVVASQTGVDFIGKLAQATGADIAASDDLTGAEAKGGDWQLEVSTGVIESTPFLATDYQRVLSTGDGVLNNGALRFGWSTTDATAPEEGGSVTTSGVLATPHTNIDGSWYQLTHGNKDLNMAIGVGGSGFDGGEIVEYGQTETGSMSDSSLSYEYTDGVESIIYVGTVTINNTSLEVTQHYSLDDNERFIKATTSIKNTSGTDIDNLRLWLGTQDDYVGSDDSPTKTAGNVDSDGFSPTTGTLYDNAIRISSGNPEDAVALFYTTNDSASAIVGNLGLGFSDVLGQDPAAAEDEVTGDDSYGLYMPYGSLAAGATVDSTWYYVAATSATIDDAAGSAADFTNISVDEDSTYTFTADAFQADGLSYDKVKLESLPNNGTLALNGSALNIGDEVTSADYTNLTYTPAENFNGSDSFEWNGYDGSSYSSVVSYDFAVNPVNDDPTGSVTITGTARKQQTLTANNDLADEDGLGTIGYQWLRDGIAITDATDDTYTLTQADVGSEISVQASYTDTLGTTETVTSVATDPVAVIPVTSTPRPSPDPDPIQVEPTPGEAKPNTPSGKPSVSETITNTGRGTGSAKLVENSGNANEVTATLPGGVSLVNQGARTAIDPQLALADLVNSIDAQQPTNLSAQTGVAGQWLANRPEGTLLDIRTLIISDNSSNSASTPIQITGIGDDDGASNSHQEAFVIDVRSLPQGNQLQLDNIDFASIVGSTTIRGGAGDNVVIGDDASQYIVLGAGDDELHGGGGDDTIGSEGGDDRLFGDSGNDELFGGAGADLLHGGSDTDTVSYEGNRDDYIVTQDHSVITVQSKADPEDIDTLINIETLAFADDELALSYDEDLAWITGLYAQVLGRQGEVEGVQYWAQQQAEGLGKADMAMLFIASPEAGQSLDAAGSIDTALDTLYGSLLGREADAPGKAYWASKLEEGVSLREVVGGFMASEEMATHNMAGTQWDFIA